MQNQNPELKINEFSNLYTCKKIPKNEIDVLSKIVMNF